MILVAAPDGSIKESAKSFRISTCVDSKHPLYDLYRVAADSVSVEGLRGSCLRCRQFDEGGAGLGAVAIDVAVTLAGLARAGPRDGVGVSLRAGDSREGTHAPPVPAEEQGEVVADIVESAGGAGALTDRTVEEAPEGLGGWEVLMGVEVAVVVEEDLSEVDVVVGVPAEDGLAAAVLNGCRYRVDDRVQVAALVVPPLGDRVLVSVRHVGGGAVGDGVDGRGVESRCLGELRMGPGARAGGWLGKGVAH